MQTMTERHLAEAREALAKHDRERDQLVAEVAALEALLAKSPQERSHATASQFHNPQEHDGMPYGSKRHRMETAIEQFLIANNKPMHRMQITDHLKEKNIVGKEQNPVGVVSNMLSSSSRFKPVGNGLWTLANRPAAAAAE